MVAAISNSSGKEKLKCDDVRDLILSESLRRKESGESSGGAYSSEGRGRTWETTKGNLKRKIEE